MLNNAFLLAGIFDSLDKNSALVPLLVAILSGGGVAALINLFMYRPNREGIISQAAQNAVMAQSTAITNLERRNKLLSEELRVAEETIEHLNQRIRALEARLARVE